MTVKELSAIVSKQADQLAAQEEWIRLIAKRTGVSLVKKQAVKPIQIPSETFKYKSKEYRFTVPKYIGQNSVPVLAADALKQPSELERLVLIESGIIEEVK